MTTRNDINEGIAHRMVGFLRRVGRPVDSFLTSDTERQLKALTEMFEEKIRLRLKENEQLRKVDDYLLSELKARGLTYPPFANATAAAAPTAAPASASVSTVPVSRNEAD